MASVKRFVACGACTVAVCVGAWTSVGAQTAQDYTQWRGTNRDGSAVAFVAPAKWPEKLTLKWKTDVGLGYATPLLVGNRVFMFTRRDADEDVQSGRRASSRDPRRAASRRGRGSYPGRRQE